jgi:hypothetical protein
MDFRDSQAMSVLSSAGYGLDRLKMLDEATRDKLAAMASGQGDRRQTIQAILAAAQKENEKEVVVEQPIEMDAAQPLVGDGE